jgi:hypothetical protein
LGPPTPPCTGVQDAVEGQAQGGAVGDEQEHRSGQHAQDQEVHDPVQGDQAQDVAVAQRAPAQRQLDVGAVGQMLLGRRGGWG